MRKTKDVRVVTSSSGTLKIFYSIMAFLLIVGGPALTGVLEIWSFILGMAYFMLVVLSELNLRVSVLQLLSATVSAIGAIAGSIAAAKLLFGEHPTVIGFIFPFLYTLPVTAPLFNYLRGHKKVPP